jgi:energy-coupling factor transporter ATP-binding protein EcfA2
MREQRDLPGALASLASTLDSLDIRNGAGSLRAERDRLAATIRGYLIPRAVDPSTPVTVVVAGPTGSGKSTLVNSLAGIDVSRAGALRPTTRIPVVVASPPHDDGLDQLGGVRCQLVIADAPLLESLVLVDSPDIDSTAPDNRARAEILIDNADVVVFVTSALRYADDVPWQVLRRAISRGTPVINVLNRVGSSSSGAVIDFKSRLAGAGLDPDPVTVPEHHLISGAQRVPSLAVRSLQRRIRDVVTERNDSSGSVLRRVLSATMSQVISLADSLSTIRGDIDGLEAELSLDLVGRVSSLDLADVCAGLSKRPPTGRNPLARRSWRRRSALDLEGMSEAEDAIVTRITSLVTEDLRHWLAASRPLLAEREIHPEPILSGVANAAKSGARAWVTYVARIAEDHQGPGSGLATVVLAEAATSSETGPAADILFATEADVLIERARRELVGRLEVIYELTASLVVEELRGRLGDFDESELRPALGAVMATLAPVHA